MRLQLKQPVDLTYCLNVHPGETWAAHEQAIRDYALSVRDRVAPDSDFGLGLRIAAPALNDLPDPSVQQAHWKEQGVYAFTVNGFPYGQFHSTRVKEQVYAPDWQTRERVDYTLGVARFLAGVLPEDCEGSISTVPGSFGPWITSSGEEDDMARRLAQVVAGLIRIREEQGRVIHLGLEPEPSCFMETTDQFIRFTRERLWREGAAELARLLDRPPARMEEEMARHVGICFDACHLAIQFEGLGEALDRIRREGMLVSKVHLSAALAASNSPEARQSLEAFNEPVYLHQVTARGQDGARFAWTDLPEALAALPNLPETLDLRIHFHVPLFWEGDGVLRSTAQDMDQAFFNRLRTGVCPHLEIETYTFDVLPEALKAPALQDSIAAEYGWVLERLDPAGEARSG